MQLQKQSPAGIFVKKCFEKIPQVYRKTLIKECDFKKVVGCSPVTLLHIFRLHFLRNTFDLPCGKCFHSTVKEIPAN